MNEKEITKEWEKEKERVFRVVPLTPQEKILIENLIDSAVKEENEIMIKWHNEERNALIEHKESQIVPRIASAVEAREREIVSAFKETIDSCHDDEIHCGCLGYCEWILEGKPEETINPSTK